ncbi:MAG: SDR family oxidoreductase [Alphaproteobacteria bacterium]|nr:SDR family oxidoreductase [Alphaproteobacteria bacterium]
MAATGTRRLAGRRIVITGAARGMGLATAEIFAAEGASLALCDRDEQAVRANAGRLGQFGAGCDVSDEADVERFCNAAEAAMGGVDGLVNAAGILIMKPMLETSLAEWQRVLDVNLTGTMLMCKALTLAMRRAGHGTMVNIASIGGLRPAPNCLAYAVSKAGVIMLSNSLAAELGPEIRVNTVCPGTIPTDMVTDLLATSRDRLIETPALKRLGTAEDVVKAMLFLTSDESSYITGDTLTVDGGWAYR